MTATLARCRRPGALLFSLTWLTLLATPLVAGDAELDRAITARDPQAIVVRMRALAKENPQAAAREIPRAYATIEGRADEFYEEVRYKIFKSAIGILGRLQHPDAIDRLKVTLSHSKDWHERFLVMHAAIINKEMNGVTLSIIGVKDKQGRVVAAAAWYLGHSRKKAACLPLIYAMKKWEQPAVRERLREGRKEVTADAPGQAWLACRDALHRLIGKSLHSWADYDNYWRAHKDEIDPTKVDIDKPREEEEGKTAVLFGMEITGINIVFILDISGSMLTSELTSEDEDRLQKPRTGVGENELLDELLRARRRIVRAKRELTKVVQALPDDKNFNIIIYSSKVTEWKGKLVPSTQDNKAEAVEFIEAIEAKGVTVTDDALARAFLDPVIDTVYLITDGAPTHIGFKLGEALPPDAKRLMRQIKADVKYWNYLRGVRIFTLGFEGAEEEFLKKLSQDHRGRYVRIR